MINIEEERKGEIHVPSDDVKESAPQNLLECMAHQMIEEEPSCPSSGEAGKTFEHKKPEGESAGSIEAAI